MRLLSKIIAGTTCVTIFAGTAYLSAITLAPPPTYTVSNADRIKSYDRLAVGNAYEKKTKSQEFYLGLSRWRRKMLREEGVLHGRVLEIGAGCGGNLAYYPSEYLTDDEEIQKYLSEVIRGGGGDNGAPGKAGEGIAANYISLILDRMKKIGSCDEIVLCDRSENMIESCSQKVQSRLGYTPYRYPDYDLDGIREYIKGRHVAGGSTANSTSGGVRKRKILHDDGSVKDVIESPVDVNDEAAFMEEGDNRLAPILQDIAPGDKLPLLSKNGEEEIRLRQVYVKARQQFRLSLERVLETREAELIEKREARMGDAMLKDSGRAMGSNRTRDTKARTPAANEATDLPQMPALLQSKDGQPATQPLFSVANYAAEQLPFPDNSFDTVVDMFVSAVMMTQCVPCGKCRAFASQEANSCSWSTGAVTPRE